MGRNKIVTCLNKKTKEKKAVSVHLVYVIGLTALLKPVFSLSLSVDQEHKCRA